jgi:hypothetical protein
MIEDEPPPSKTPPNPSTLVLSHLPARDPQLYRCIVELTTPHYLWPQAKNVGVASSSKARTLSYCDISGWLAFSLVRDTVKNGIDGRLNDRITDWLIRQSEIQQLFNYPTTIPGYYQISRLLPDPLVSYYPLYRFRGETIDPWAYALDSEVK